MGVGLLSRLVRCAVLLGQCTDRRVLRWRPSYVVHSVCEQWLGLCIVKVWRRAALCE